MGPRASQDLRSPSPIMAPAHTYEILLWDIPEIFAAEDDKAAHFKKI